MSTRVSPTASVEADAFSEGAGSSVADIASNELENYPTQVVRNFYARILPVRGAREKRERPNAEGHDLPSVIGPTEAPPRPPLPGDHDLGTQATDDRLQEQRVLRAPVLSGRPSSRITSYVALQEWEGYVTSVGAATFTADLVDVTKFARYATEQAQIPLQEIGVEERQELRIGSIFRWTIGYETLPSGQRQRVSKLVFRQLPKWSQADIDAANRLGQDRHRRIKWG